MINQRILISYFFHEKSIPLGTACADALQDLGYEVFTFHSQDEHFSWPFVKKINSIIKAITAKPFDITSNSSWNNQIHRENALKAAVDSIKPDLLLVIRGNNFSKETLQYLKRNHPSLKLVGWWVKDPRQDNQLIDDSKIYDHYFCMHKFGYTEKDNIQHLPALAIYNKLYRPIKNNDITNKNARDVCFVGCHAPRREQFINHIKHHSLSIYGPGWRKNNNLLDYKLMKCRSGSSIWGEDLVKLYAASKIVLNISLWDPSAFSGQNLRLFDVPACKAFLLTEYSEEISDFFVTGKEIETFKTPEELNNKIEYYLKYPEKRQRIAQLGYEKSLKLPTYKEKMKTLLKYIGN